MDDLLNEFIMEAFDLLEDCEQEMLSLESKDNFEKVYNKIFRVFHSLKGSSAMFGMTEVQRHMHLLEDHFQLYKGKYDDFKPKIDHFLLGIEVARKSLKGEKTEFNYEELKTENSTPKDKNTLTIELLDRAVKLLMFQNSYLEVYLLEGKKNQILEVFNEEIKKIIYELKELKK